MTNVRSDPVPTRSDPTAGSRRLGVLISGRGSNLQAIIDAVKSRRLNAEIAVVISNKSDAAGLKRAQDAEYPQSSSITQTRQNLRRVRSTTSSSSVN